MRQLEQEFHEPFQVARRVHPSHFYGSQLAEAVEHLSDLVEEAQELVERPRASGNQLAMRRGEDGSVQLAMDVSGFKPEDIKINLVGDHLSVEAKNESSGENSYSRSEIKRWFKLPEDCKVEDIKSNLTKDNKLMISLPSSKPAVEPARRSIPINVEPREAIKENKDAQPAKPADKK